MTSSTTADGGIHGFRERHPRGLWVLFFAEMWERFSFYGMRGLLFIYLTSHVLQYKDSEASLIYGAYGSLVYAFPILGGWLADKWLGYRKAVVLGGVLMALGHLVMAIENHFGLYAALGLLCVGNGFFKPNISSTVGRLYAEGDPMRDRGFTIFYMGINIGALVAPLLCGYLGETYGWKYGFGLAGIGMVIGLIVYIKGQHLLEGQAEPPDPAKLQSSVAGKLNLLQAIWIGAFLLVPLASLLVKFHGITDYLLYAVGLIILFVILRFMTQVDRIAKQRIIVYMILWVSHTAFWMLFEQAGTSLTAFARDHVDRDIDMLNHWELPVSWFQSVNPSFIVLLAPLFVILWAKLDKWRINPSIPAKFGLGVLILALGYLVLVWGAESFAGGDSRTPLIFIVLCYMLHTMGELCLAPVGLSAVTKLVPRHTVGFFMGTWFLSISYAHHFAGKIAGEATSAEGQPAAERLDLLSNIYFQGALWLVGASVVLILFSRLINKMAHGVK